jgi:hypothetical protein
MVAPQRDRQYAQSVQQRIIVVPPRPPQQQLVGGSSHNCFGDVASDQLFVGNQERGSNTNKDNNNMEAVPPGCHYQEWQLNLFPNYNDLHEINLKALLKFLKSSSSSKQNQHKSPSSCHTNTNNDTTPTMDHYINCGLLWRDVWSLMP